MKGNDFMKKLAAMILAGVMCASTLTACGGVPENEVHSLSDLEGKTIGVQIGTVGMTIASDIADTTVEKYSKGADAVQALKQGKIDAVIIDGEPAKVFVSNNDDLMILDEKYDPESYAIAIKKGNDELTEKINDALKTLTENGTLDNIKKNWIGDEKGKSPYTTPEGTTYPNGTLVMATNAEFPPYESREDGEIVGLDVDMMRAVCDVLGYEHKIDDMAFDSIIAAVESGKADVGVAGMTVNEDRLKNVDFSDSYTTTEQVVIVRKK